MSRPECIEELDAWSQRPHDVASIHSEWIVQYPTLGQHFLGALIEAERLGLIVKDGTIQVPLTEAEEATRLKRAQESWDTTAGWYRVALEDPTSLEQWKRNSVDSHIRSEDLEPIEWPMQVPA